MACECSDVALVSKRHMGQAAWNYKRLLEGIDPGTKEFLGEPRPIEARTLGLRTAALHCVSAGSGSSSSSWREVAPTQPAIEVVAGTSCAEDHQPGARKHALDR